jgi:hypothetical protein
MRLPSVSGFVAGDRRLVVALAACVALAGIAGAEDVSKLTALTVEKAEELAAKKPVTKACMDGYFWPFDSLTSLTPEVAAVLAEVTNPLSFNGLTEISPETAAALAKHPPSSQKGFAHLRLNGIRRLSPEAAAALATHEGKVLLYSLERLDSLPLAQKIAREEGEIRLGLTELTPEIAAELAKNKGTLNFRPGGYGRVDRAASVLRIDGIHSLSPETAEALAAHEGVLVLNGLTTLQPDVAAALAKRTGNSKVQRTGTLVLNGLESISTEAAAAIAAFKGDLVLKAIAELSPESAAALAKQKGRLYLTGLKTLSPETLAALRAHPNILLPQPLPPEPAAPR